MKTLAPIAWIFLIVFTAQITMATTKRTSAKITTAVTTKTSKNWPNDKALYTIFLENSYSSFSKKISTFEDRMYFLVKKGLRGNKLEKALEQQTRYSGKTIQAAIPFFLKSTYLVSLNPYQPENASVRKEKLAELETGFIHLIDSRVSNASDVMLYLQAWEIASSGCPTRRIINEIVKLPYAEEVLAKNKKCNDSLFALVEQFSFKPAYQLYFIDQTNLGTLRKLYLLQSLREKFNKGPEKIVNYLSAYYLNLAAKNGFMIDFMKVFNGLDKKIQKKMIAGLKISFPLKFSDSQFYSQNDHFYFVYELLSHYYLTRQNKFLKNLFHSSAYRSIKNKNLNLDKLFSYIVEQPNQDLYDLFIDLTKPGTDADFHGMFFSLITQPPVFKMVGAYLSKQKKYPQFSRTLLEDINELHVNRRGHKILDEFVDKRINRHQFALFKKNLLVNREKWIKNMTSGFGEITNENVALPSLLHKKLKIYTELKLDKKYWANLSEKTLIKQQHALKNIHLPKTVKGIVRVETQKENVLVIYQSQDVDPVGEISPGGYWLIRSDNKGETWSQPYYLGLQVYQPYVISQFSNLPLLDGDSINIEVRRVDIDRTTITFPPVALKFKQGDKNSEHLYLRFKWTDLTRDSDGDFLSDLLEEKLGLDLHNKDTDNDGIEDDADMLPNLALRYDLDNRSSMMKPVLQKIFGFEQNAIITNADQAQDILKSFQHDQVNMTSSRTLFIRGPANYFQSLLLPFRVIILQKKDLQQYTRKWPVFYPVTVSIYSNHAATKGFVSWSAGWTGGTLVLVKKDGRWLVIDGSTWVT